MKYVAKWFGEFFTQNVGLKVISVALAVMLWLLIAADPITEAAFHVPVEFVNVPPKLEVLTEDNSVRLWARGPSRAIRKAMASDFTVRVNVGDVTAHNQALYSLPITDVTAPSSLEVKELIPDVITISLDQTATKEVPVRPRFFGEPTNGLHLKDAVVSPSTVRITGPASHLDMITSASTVLLDLSKLSPDQSLTAGIAISDPLIRVIQPQSVRITVRLEAANGSDLNSSPKPGS